MTLSFTALLIAACLAAIHLFVSRMRILRGVPRSRWLSAAGGAAVAYIFLHLLPDLAAAHRRAGVESETVYFVIALVGLVAFYGVERRVRLARAPAGHAGADDSAAGVFWLHAGSLTLYNLIIGYLLLHREEAGLASLLLYGSAMGLHFLSNDYGMQLDHPQAYNRTARWILAAAILLGWLAGRLIEVPRPIVDGLFAFLAGGVVLNVMKEELPEERKSRFNAFLLGVVAYGALLLVLG
ncbi:hypothetical protein QMO56_02510 [Roseomonas sp. E05]|uniref:hypothetical protein n=1 Tax=Roseomonas sp. E05 TaxID=3046310 RepID=UPI0024BAE17C|nr:hypothetical protein [Roseomonas sp. E05]MDJ0386973.1 hypothetical protein [Roseomonas sp. E05]